MLLLNLELNNSTNQLNFLVRFRLLNRFVKTFNINDQSKLRLSIFANNLLDEVARNHSSFVKNEVPLPGRNYGLKFKLVF